MRTIVLVALLTCAGFIYGKLPIAAWKPAHAPDPEDQQAEMHCAPGDSSPTYTFIIYVSDNQLKRKFHIQLKNGESFSLTARASKTIEVPGAVVEGVISVFGHRTNRFVMTLSGAGTHYFRVQDRNNYAGTRPFLELIEVTQEQYNRDLP